jgi:beta-galactosidase
MGRQSLAAVARGSAGAMFFQWRAARGGAELFHSALVPHAGEDTRVYREAVELGRQLGAVAEVTAGAVQARVAVVYDEPSAWALQAPGLPASGLDHLAEARRVHRALWQRGITADVIGDLDDLDRYAMLLLPAHYLMSDTQAAALRSWVYAGGHLVVGYLSGVADQYGRVRTGGYPGALRDLLGVWVEEFHPLAPDDRVALSTGHHATFWTEVVHARGARVELRYAGGVLDGRPAVTRHRTGSGVSWYLSTRLECAHLADLLAAVAAEAGVHPVVPGLPAGVESVRRDGTDRAWLFLLNHTDTAHDVPADGWELLTATAVTGVVSVPAGGAAVVRLVPASSESGTR